MTTQTLLPRLRRWTGPLVVLIAIGLGYHILDVNYPGVSNGYDGISRSLGYYYTLGPALAGFSAWDMSRFRTLLGQRGSNVDLWRTVLRRLTAPSLITLLFVVLVINHGGGLSTSQTWAGILLTVVLTFLWIFFGTALGMYLPPVISLPVAVFVPWILTAYPQAVPDPAWRQMFGQPVGGCCTVDAMIDPVTINSSATTLGLLLVASVILIQVRVTLPPIRACGIGAALIITCTAVFLGHALGTPGNVMNAAPRPNDERDCDNRVCVWPESDRSMVDTNLQVAENLGIPAGTVLVDGEPRNDHELWMSGDPDPTIVEQHLLIQLLEHSSELRSMASCWVNEIGQPLSMADNAAAVLGSSELVPAATDSRGHYLAYSGIEDPSTWDRVADLINRESGCTA